MRDGEVNGRDYWFVTKEEFQSLKDEDGLIDAVDSFGHSYGMARESIDVPMSKGKWVVTAMDLHGIEQLEKHLKIEQERRHMKRERDTTFEEIKRDDI